MQFYDKKDNKVFTLKVPTKQGRQLFVYYRLLTVQDKLSGLSYQDKQLYKVFQKEKRKKIGKMAREAKEKTTHSQNTKRTIGDITLKTFANPLRTKKDKEKEAPKKKTDEEALDNISVKRTILVFNFDNPFDADQVKSWFKTLGKIRSVFVGQHSNKKANAEGKKTLFFGLVVFHNIKDLQVCLEHPAVFQERVHQYLKTQNISIDEAERAEYREKLVTNFAAEELAGKKDEFVERMESDGFTMVVDHTGGYEKFKKNFGREDSDEEEKQAGDGEDMEDFDSGPTKKKKKEHAHSDFYRFQVKNNAAIKNLGVKGFNKQDTDAMGYQIDQVKKGFQEDVERLRALRQNKMNQAADDDEDEVDDEVDDEDEDDEEDLE